LLSSTKRGRDEYDDDEFWDCVNYKDFDLEITEKSGNPGSLKSPETKRLEINKKRRLLPCS
jgi:hypothetical protein